ncbi:MAG: phosphate acyltransferase PlsX [Candidatus Tectomicrobia bacterium]|uniref:Phosphate acyltransferase n=1 Tax=Tectimicrobiota bacterium TaxID=2528274 RepID=A0A933GNA5_UNCTE|nr:phosphate acyltransferase PlsX [Candidatus Tectomicrobia bacterium]
MGGDEAPKVPVKGAVEAAQKWKIPIVLVGDISLIKSELQEYDIASLPISIRPASQVIGMDEAPAVALRKKKDSSIKVTLEMIKRGEAQAAVSAGSTGAALAASILILKTLKGIDRPAIGTVLPTLNGGNTLVLDVGANVDCKPQHLFQFGVMGHAYAKHVLNKPFPNIGLLSIGEEDSKGNGVTKEAFQLFKKSPMNFSGNIEGHEIFSGHADVVVCDGFIGNVALKITESTVEWFVSSLKKLFESSWRGKAAYLLIAKGLEKIKKQLDYAEYGGAPLLGINGVCIICHGRSNSKAIQNAILLARTFAQNRVNDHIQEDLAFLH